MSKYSHPLEEDSAFRARYRNVLRGSLNTAAGYLLHLGRVCDEVARVSPAQIASMNKAEPMTFVSNVISDLEEAGAPPGLTLEAGECAGGGKSSIQSEGWHGHFRGGELIPVG